VAAIEVSTPAIASIFCEESIVASIELVSLPVPEYP